MLLQSVLLSKSILLASEPDSFEVLVQSLQHLAVLTNVIVFFDAEILKGLLNNEVELCEKVKSIVMAVPFGFGSTSPFDDNLTLRLLDAGGPMVIYHDGFLRNNKSIDSSLAAQEVISSFPRSRQCLRFHAAVDLEFILNAVRQYRNIISTFIVRYYKSVLNTS